MATGGAGSGQTGVGEGQAAALVEAGAHPVDLVAVASLAKPL